MYSKQTDTTQKPAFSRSKRLISTTAILVSVLAVVFNFSSIAHADLASLISAILGNQQVSAEITPSTKVADSQISRAIVLQASGSLNRDNSVSDTPPIYDQNTLSPALARMNATTSEPTSTFISTYVVRSGDNLSGVAHMFNVSVNTILWANDLNSKSVLKPGQILVILPVTGISYTIKSKDTIQSIAKKYNSDIEDILNYNDMTLSSKLVIGDQIIIPDAEIATPPVSKTTPSRVVRVGQQPILDGWDYPSYPGYYACPVPGSRVSQQLHGHNGIDLAAPRGTPVLAAAEGTVIISRSNGAWNGGYGNFVVIMHTNGTQTLYSHLSRSKVSVGENVAKWQTIGFVGMTGLTTGPHTHFEIRGAQNPFGNSAACSF